jgi:TolB-like protein
LWAAGVAAVLVGAGFWAWSSSDSSEGTLPPGFTFTTGQDSGGAGDPGSSSGSIGSLIDPGAAGESGRFQASIAILPLENRTGNILLDTLGHGLTEELITRLSQVRGLKVISLQSVQELEGLDLAVEEVADTLGVDHLLQGTVLPYSDAARIDVRLVRIVEASETELWRNDYSLDRTNQLRAVEDISDEVSAALLADVASLTERPPFRSTASPGYPAYLAGSRQMNTRTRDGFLRAIDAFELSIREDSTFALAYAGLSSVYALSVTYRYDIGIDAYAAAGMALTAADHAVRLEPDLAEAYAARGYISSVALAPTEMVLEDFTRAMELQPNAPNVPAWYANLLARESYYDQALEQAQRAVALDPLSPARRTGWAYEALRARDYPLAIREAQTAVNLQSDVILPRAIHALALILSGQAEECLNVNLGPHSGLRAICLHDLGRVEQAQAIADSLRTVLRTGEQAHPEFTNVIPAGDLAAYLSWTGQPERAIHWIHRAFAMSPNGIDPRVLNSGVFESLLDDGQLRREVAEIRDRVWTRVLGEWLEAEVVMGEGDR